MPRRKEDQDNVVTLPTSFMSRGGALAAHRLAEDFAPTGAMRSARARCQELVDAGTLSLIDWLPVLQRERLVTSQAWREWQVMDGFDQWWYDGLYPAPSSNSLKSMIPTWVNGLEKAMAKGDMRGIEWYHKWVLSKTDDGMSPLERLLREREGQGNKWTDGATKSADDEKDD